VGWQDRRSSAGYNDRIPATSKPPGRTSTWQDDLYDRDPPQAGVNRSYTSQSPTSYEKPKPARPTAPKPNFGKKADQAIAKFTFEGEQEGDLSFKKGDIITIVQRTDNETDWWTGRVGAKEGIFPSNYVELV